MGQLRKITTGMCATCKFRCHIGNFGHNGEIACNYLDVMGESRVFVGGKKVIPDGYCDKYEYGAQSLTSARKWCNENFSCKIRIRKDGVAFWQT